MSSRRLPTNLSINVNSLDYAPTAGSGARATTPLSPAVIRAVVNSNQRFNKEGGTPRSTASDDSFASRGSERADRRQLHSLSPHLNHPISPRVLAAAASSQRRLSYKLSKEELKIPPPLEEGGDDEASSQTSSVSHDGPVYTVAEMIALRGQMATHSPRMRQRYTITPVAPVYTEHPGTNAGWRDGDNNGRGRDAAGRWTHNGGRAGIGNGQQMAGVEREVMDGDIDQTVPRQLGTIVFMPSAKYGFIRPKRPAGDSVHGGQGKQGDFFFHATEIKDAVPRVGDSVTFQIARPSWSHRVLAVRVKITEPSLATSTGNGDASDTHRHFRNTTGVGRPKQTNGWRSSSNTSQSRFGGNNAGAGSGTRRWASNGHTGGWRSGSIPPPTKETTPMKRSGFARMAAGPVSSGGRSKNGFASRTPPRAEQSNSSTKTQRSRNGVQRRVSPNRRSLNTKAAVSRKKQQPSVKGFGRQRSTVARNFDQK